MAEFIAPVDLAPKIAKTLEMPLLLDCRPFLQFNLERIKNARHINCCDRISRKRLENLSVSILDLLKLRREDLASREVVLYDEATQQDHPFLAEKMPIFIVTRCFLREGKQPYILNGGLVRFKSELGLELLERFGPPLESPSAEPCSSSTSSEPAAKMSKKKKDVVPYDDLIRSHPKISEITHGLFLGNIHASSDPKLLASYGITHVVNCTASASNEFPDYLTYLRIPARDAPSQNLSQYFEEARRFISKAIDEEKGAVLVHCHAGISRSSTIVLAYLISEEGLSLNTAFDLVQKRRSIVAPNFSFMGQLSDYARAIHEPLPAPPPPVHQLGGATADSVERKLQEMKEA